jgi:hypothetical protein
LLGRGFSTANPTIRRRSRWAVNGDSRLWLAPASLRRKNAEFIAVKSNVYDETIRDYGMRLSGREGRWNLMLAGSLPAGSSPQSLTETRR